MTKWISVEERYPPEGEWVHVWRGNENTDPAKIAPIVTAFFNGQWWGSMGMYRLTLWNVTHWIPLPDPPEEARDDRDTADP